MFLLFLPGSLGGWALNSLLAAALQCQPCPGAVTPTCLMFCIKLTRTGFCVSLFSFQHIKYNHGSLCALLYSTFFPDCFSHAKSGMSHLIFHHFPTGFLGKLGPVALEAAKMTESVMVLSSHPGLRLPDFVVGAVWELELRAALGSCSQ